MQQKLEKVEPQEEPTLLHKLHAIMRAIPRIQKDATNPHHKYAYASEKAIKEAIHPLLVEHGVLFQLAITGPPEDTKAGLLVPMEYSFTDVDSGQQIRQRWYGSGHDRDEKGLYAAITGALKYALTTTFLIPTGDDPEAADKMEQPTKKENNAELTCYACGVVSQLSDVYSMPAKKAGRGVEVGDLIYKCDCGKWQGVGEASVRAEMKEPKQKDAPGLCKSCGKETETQNQHGDCPECQERMAEDDLPF